MVARVAWSVDDVVVQRHKDGGLPVPQTGFHKGPPRTAPLPSPLRSIHLHFVRLMRIIADLSVLTLSPSSAAKGQLDASLRSA